MELSAKKRILKWLLNPKHSLTQKECTEMFGHTRLAARICELKKLYTIERTMIYKKKSHYASYRILSPGIGEKGGMVKS